MLEHARRFFFFSLAAMHVAGGVALAHPGLDLTPATFWSAWNPDPLILSGLGVFSVLYLRGTLLLWRRAGVGKGVSLWQALAFAGGVWTLFLALVSPLDALGHALFSAHMAQHMLLVLLAAPLLAFAAPIVPLLWALPRGSRQRLLRFWQRAGRLRHFWHALSQPVIVWCLFAVALWIWHLPGLYQAAVLSPLVHFAEHSSMLLAALLFWWLIIQPVGRRRLNYGAALFVIFTTSIHSTVLGALFVFAPTPLYPIYETTAATWNLTLLEDQQLAGFVMRTPGTIVFLFAAGALFLLWLREMERRASPARPQVQRKLPPSSV